MDTSKYVDRLFGLSTDTRPTPDRQGVYVCRVLVGCKSGDGQVSVVKKKCRSGVGRVSVGCKSGVGRVSVIYLANRLTYSNVSVVYFTSSNQMRR